jgi:hypothetical protein
MSTAYGHHVQLVFKSQNFGFKFWLTNRNSGLRAMKLPVRGSESLLRSVVTVGGWILIRSRAFGTWFLSTASICGFNTSNLRIYFMWRTEFISLRDIRPCAKYHNSSTCTAAQTWNRGGSSRSLTSPVEGEEINST